MWSGQELWRSTGRWRVLGPMCGNWRVSWGHLLYSDGKETWQYGGWEMVILSSTMPWQLARRRCKRLSFSGHRKSSLCPMPITVVMHTYVWCSFILLVCLYLYFSLILLSLAFLFVAPWLFGQLFKERYPNIVVVCPGEVREEVEKCVHVDEDAAAYLLSNYGIHSYRPPLRTQFTEYVYEIPFETRGSELNSSHLSGDSPQYSALLFCDYLISLTPRTPLLYLFFRLTGMSTEPNTPQSSQLYLWMAAKVILFSALSFQKFSISFFHYPISIFPFSWETNVLYSFCYCWVSYLLQSLKEVENWKVELGKHSGRVKVLLFTHGSPIYTNIQESFLPKKKEEVTYSLMPVVVKTKDDGNSSK